MQIRGVGEISKGKSVSGHVLHNEDVCVWNKLVTMLVVVNQNLYCVFVVISSLQYSTRPHEKEQTYPSQRNL
jgi:hypothetical protein